LLFGQQFFCWPIFLAFYFREVGKIVGVPYLNYITYDSKRATNYGRLWYGISCNLLF